VSAYFYLVRRRILFLAKHFLLLRGRTCNIISCTRGALIASMMWFANLVMFYGKCRLTGKSVHFAKKCRVIDCPPTCKKHARHNPTDTTWIEWVTTGRLELVFNTQILGYWKDNKKRKRSSPKRYMHEQSADCK